MTRAAQHVDSIINSTGVHGVVDLSSGLAVQAAMRQDISIGLGQSVIASCFKVSIHAVATGWAYMRPDKYTQADVKALNHWLEKFTEQPVADFLASLLASAALDREFTKLGAAGAAGSLVLPFLLKHNRLFQSFYKRAQVIPGLCESIDARIRDLDPVVEIVVAAQRDRGENAMPDLESGPFPEVPIPAAYPRYAAIAEPEATYDPWSTPPSPTFTR